LVSVRDVIDHWGREKRNRKYLVSAEIPPLKIFSQEKKGSDWPGKNTREKKKRNPQLTREQREHFV